MPVARLAATIARQRDSELFMAHLIESTGGPAGRALSVEQSQMMLVQRVRSWLRRVARDAGVTGPTNSYVDFADPAQALLALSGHADNVIVMGARGLGSARAALLGSVSRRVASQACCPVIILSPEAVEAWSDPDETRAVRPIVCGIDGSEESHLAARWAASLPADRGASLLLAHCGDSPQTPPATPSGAPPPVDFTALLQSDRRARLRILRRASESLPEHVKREVVLLGGRPGSALRDLARGRDAQLIAVGSRGRGVIRSALLGSTSATLAESAPCPTLICPQSAVHRSALGLGASPGHGRRSLRA